MKQQLTITGVKHWTRSQIEEGLRTNDMWVIKGLLALYTRQTQVEQRTEKTHDKNWRGFSATDAPRLTSYAKFYQNRGFLSSKQLYVARQRIMKYAQQLANIANEKAGV